MPLIEIAIACGVLLGLLVGAIGPARRLAERRMASTKP